MEWNGRWNRTENSVWKMPEWKERFQEWNGRKSRDSKSILEVKASHANAYARAIAFFSYIWYKYNILSLQRC